MSGYQWRAGRRVDDWETDAPTRVRRHAERILARIPPDDPLVILQRRAVIEIAAREVGPAPRPGRAG